MALSGVRSPWLRAARNTRGVWFAGCATARAISASSLAVHSSAEVPSTQDAPRPEASQPNDARAVTAPTNRLAISPAF